MTTAANPGCFAIVRNAYRMSWIRVSTAPYLSGVAK
jgi:hypothetical protein